MSTFRDRYVKYVSTLSGVNDDPVEIGSVLTISNGNPDSTVTIADNKIRFTSSLSGTDTFSLLNKTLSQLAAEVSMASIYNIVVTAGYEDYPAAMLLPVVLGDASDSNVTVFFEPFDYNVDRSVGWMGQYPDEEKTRSESFYEIFDANADHDLGWQTTP